MASDRKTSGVVLQPQPFGEADRFADPNVVHELPMFELDNLRVGPELSEPETTETSMGDHQSQPL